MRLIPWALVQPAMPRAYSYAELAAIAGVPTEGPVEVLVVRPEMGNGGPLPTRITWCWYDDRGRPQVRVAWGDGHVRAWPRAAFPGAPAELAPLPPLEDGEGVS